MNGKHWVGGEVNKKAKRRELSWYHILCQYIKILDVEEEEEGEVETHLVKKVIF